MRRLWRSAAIAMPPEGEDVLLHIPGSGRASIVLGHRAASAWYEAAPAGEAYLPLDVEPSHWMPLPLPPPRRYLRPTPRAPSALAPAAGSVS
jgi:hypothetical protein